MGARGRRRAADADWSTIGVDHAVQFYDEDESLIHQLGNYVGAALVRGEASVVIATRPHREGLVATLLRRGFDVGIARRQGRFVALDAAELLAQVSQPDGGLAEERFQELALGLVRKAAASADGGRRRVTVFGEMVALLWARDPRLAIRVEERWNHIQEQSPCPTCCAYPMSLFEPSLHAAEFVRLCAQHSHVFSALPERGPQVVPAL
jgi:hypothetical protein